MSDIINIHGYELIQTCGACPEQYDVLLDDTVVGYLRLRHGYFYAECYPGGRTTVYESYPRGDGVFESDERMPELTKAVNAIHWRIKSQAEEVESLKW